MNRFNQSRWLALPGSFGLTLALAAGIASVAHAEDDMIDSLEREALIGLYEATGGEEWFVNDGWLGEPGTECDWYGVSCGDPRSEGIVTVTGVILRDNNLTGTLPNLADLSGTGIFDLSGNALEGPLPNREELPEMLFELDLSHNQFSGPLSASVISAAGMDSPGWMRLKLTGNQITGPLPEVEPGGSVGGILLADNQIDDASLPESWAGLLHLGIVDLSNNPLPPDFSFPTTVWDNVFDLRIRSAGLEGEIPQEIANLVDLRKLDLSDNRLEGELPSFLVEMPFLRELHLSGNDLGGELPATLWELETDAHYPDPDDFPRHELDLSDNQFSGPLPDNDVELNQFRVINLSNNQLEGSIAPVLAATAPDARYVKLNDNLFSGEIPMELAELEDLGVVQGGGGLNLCWNPLDPPAAELHDFLSDHHRGGVPGICLDRPRSELDLTVSGSWFDASRVGEGLSLLLLENDQALIYWFTYDETGGQRWYYGVGEPGEYGVGIEDLMTVSGEFGVGATAHHPVRLGVNHPAPTLLRFDRTGTDSAVVEQGMPVYPECLMPGAPDACFSYWRHIHVEQTPLSRLAGTRCDAQQPHQWISGAWYDPDRDGEGFIVEVNHDGRGVVYWFTYQPDGSGLQAWMMGDGDFDGTTLTIDTLYQPVSDTPGELMEPVDVDMQPWGSLVLEFTDEDEGHAWFDSAIADYGSGDFALVRLAKARLADCDDD